MKRQCPLQEHHTVSVDTRPITTKLQTVIQSIPQSISKSMNLTIPDNSVTNAEHYSWRCEATCNPLSQSRLPRQYRQTFESVRLPRIQTLARPNSVKHRDSHRRQSVKPVTTSVTQSVIHSVTPSVVQSNQSLVR